MLRRRKPGTNTETLQNRNVLYGQAKVEDQNGPDLKTREPFHHQAQA